jgi:hypothetical protein
MAADIRHDDAFGPQDATLFQIRDWNGWPAVGALATGAGVHRVHLARQFRRSYGTSVSD